MTQLNVPGATLVPHAEPDVINRKGRIAKGRAVIDSVHATRLLILGFWLTDSKDDDPS